MFTALVIEDFSFGVNALVLEAMTDFPLPYFTLVITLHYKSISTLSSIGPFTAQRSDWYHAKLEST